MLSGRTGRSGHCIAIVRPLVDPTRRARNGPESREWQSYKNVTLGIKNDVSDN